MNKIILFLLLLLSGSCQKLKQPDTYFLVVGTYTDAQSEGIYTFEFDINSGNNRQIGSLALENPSFLTFSTDKKRAYAVSENDTLLSKVNALSFDDKTGIFTLLNQKNVFGAWPCHVSYDETKNLVITSNYGGGSLSVYQTNNQGKLTDTLQYIPFVRSSEKPSHAHSTQFSPDGDYAFTADLGNDSIFRFDVIKTEKGFQLKKSSLGSMELPPRTGPRHFTFDKGGKFMYVLGELSGKIHVYSYEKGLLSEIQEIASDTIPAGGSADIHINPDGKFLYASNRLKNDGIAIFSIAKTGKLSRIGYHNTAKHPRNFRISPNGKYLLVACRDNDVIQVFEIQPNGFLKDTQKNIPLSKPVYLEFVKKQR